MLFVAVFEAQYLIYSIMFGDKCWENCRFLEHKATKCLNQEYMFFQALWREAGTYWHTTGKIHTFSRLLTQGTWGVAARTRFCDSPKTRLDDGPPPRARLVFRRPIDPAGAIFTAPPPPHHAPAFTTLKSANKLLPKSVPSSWNPAKIFRYIVISALMTKWNAIEFRLWCICLTRHSYA